MAKAQATTPRKSLSDYAADKRAAKAKDSCWICSIAEAQEINAERKKGRTFPEIVGWLVDECHYAKEDATEHRVRRHFRKCPVVA